VVTRDYLLVIAVALAASLGGLFNDFVYDDVPIIRDNARLHGLSHWREIVARPYWPPPFVEQLYRPLASLLFTLEYAIGGGAPIVFRLVSYLLYATAAVCVLRLGARIVGARAALVAAILFAAHPVHVEAVALGVNQGELIVGLVAVLAAIRYLDARRRNDLAVGDWTVIAICFAIAILTKENGFVLPLLLVACEIVVAERWSLREWLEKTWKGFAILAAVGVCAVILRGVVLRDGAIGATTAQDLRGLGVGGRMATMLQVVPMWLRLLGWPAHLQADYAPGAIVAPSGLGVPEAVGIGLICITFGLIWLARAEAPAVSLGLAWCVVALLPVSNIVPTGILLAERTLFLPSVGFVIAVVGAAGWLARRLPLEEAQVRRLFVVAAGVLVVLGIVRSESRHLVWNSKHIVVLRPAKNGTAPLR
jgi:hypothetical protein